MKRDGLVRCHALNSLKRKVKSFLFLFSMFLVVWVLITGRLSSIQCNLECKVWSCLSPLLFIMFLYCRQTDSEDKNIIYFKKHKLKKQGCYIDDQFTLLNDIYVTIISLLDMWFAFKLKHVLWLVIWYLIHNLIVYRWLTWSFIYLQFDCVSLTNMVITITAVLGFDSFFVMPMRHGAGPFSHVHDFNAQTIVFSKRGLCKWSLIMSLLTLLAGDVEFLASDKHVFILKDKK